MILVSVHRKSCAIQAYAPLPSVQTAYRFLLLLRCLHYYLVVTVLIRDTFLVCMIHDGWHVGLGVAFQEHGDTMELVNGELLVGGDKPFAAGDNRKIKMVNGDKLVKGNHCHHRDLSQLRLGLKRKVGKLPEV
ncbi:hypothetical protein L2E82_43358 [Cichorium intybus]|uniref:Uncharacterized protein n=1 Tax=Cichorium intybus TaxID=13427 RepID=A0ACB8ZSY6_CICIN|nr:hypothetical protein L2E82_43358 [Cichorium intybus]